MRKRGEMVTENAIGLILAIAATIVLILLLIALFDSSYSKAEETSKSYYDSLKYSILEAKSDGASSFFMLDMADEELRFYLVYFGESFRFVKENENENALIGVDNELEFIRSEKSGPLCICYWQEEKTVCDDCVKIDGTVSSIEGQGSPWMVGEGIHVNINNKDGESYAFSWNQ